MKAPVWITEAVLLAVQEDLLARFGGLSGLRDAGLLHSALSRPRNRFAYEQSTIFDLAAEYTLGVVKNHPFLDGNKRAGFMAAYIFLGANGMNLSAPEEEVVVYTLGLAAGEIGLPDYAAWLERSCTANPL